MKLKKKINNLSFHLGKILKSFFCFFTHTIFDINLLYFILEFILSALEFGPFFRRYRQVRLIDKIEKYVLYSVYNLVDNPIYEVEPQ